MKIILFTLFVIIGAIQAQPAAFLEKLKPLQNRDVVDDAFSALSSLQDDITNATERALKVQDDVWQLSQNLTYKIDRLINERIYQLNLTDSCLFEIINDITNVTNEGYDKVNECQSKTYAKFEEVQNALSVQRFEILKKFDHIFYEVIWICFNEDPESSDECIENKRGEVNDLINEAATQTERVIETSDSQVAVIKSEFVQCLAKAYDTAVNKVDKIVEHIENCVDKQPTHKSINH